MSNYQTIDEFLAPEGGQPDLRTSLRLHDMLRMYKAEPDEDGRYQTSELEDALAEVQHEEGG